MVKINGQLQPAATDGDTDGFRSPSGLTVADMNRKLSAWLRGRGLLDDTTQAANFGQRRKPRKEAR